MKSVIRAVCLLLACLWTAVGFATEADRIQVKLDASEAEQVLAIVAKHRQGKAVTDADWNALFATEPYRRLKLREAAMHRDFTDDDFRKFVLSEEVERGWGGLSQTLAAWKIADMHAAGTRILPYLPAEATIHVKVFPEIKPKHNSFVFDTETDPAIFLYLDPKVSPEEFANTVSHEMHHIGLSSTNKIYDKKIATLPPGARKAAEWMGAFGEGEAVLAAAGGPDVPPQQYSRPDVQQNWARGMSTFNQDLETVDAFFLDVIKGRLQGEAADQKAYSFFGEIQGPWYTVGYRMAVLIEKRYGRQAFIECMLDHRFLLARYNKVAEEVNASGREHLALWSSEMLKAVEADSTYQNESRMSKR